MNLRLGKNNNTELKSDVINDLGLNQINETQFDELREDKKLRTANSKVFVLPNGDYRKVVYAKNVHYFNEEEEAYRTIDNTFVPVLDENYNEITGYENRYNSCKIRLAAKLEAKKLISISKGKYNISWEIMEDTSAEDAVQTGLNQVGKIRKLNRLSVAQVKETLKDKKAIRKEIAPANLDGEIIYKDAFEKADLQYSIHSNAVKENIIIKEQSDSYEFAFKITVKNLNVKLSEDRQNLVFCSDIGDDVFKIPMPVMQDAAGKMSSEIYYDIDDCEEGENVFIFKIIADSAWINAPERILPVTIDPMISVYDKAYNIDYSYQNSKGSTFNGIGVNKDNNKGINRLFVKLGVPDFGKDVIVNSVKLNLGTYSDFDTKNFKGLVAYRLSSVFDKNALSFNTPYESKALDMVQFLPDNVATIDLTEYFEYLYYEGKYTQQPIKFSNNGIVIKALNETSTNNNCVELMDDFNLVFDYRVNSGMHKNQAYSTNELGRSGVSQVNIRTGSLTFVHEDIKVEGNRFPVNIVNVYNSYAANGGYDLNGTPETNCPKFATNGWKINYQQFLIPETYVTDRGTYVQRFRYIDGEGTTHYLENKGSSNYNLVFADEDGLGLTLYIKGSTWNSQYVVYDSQQNQMFFDNRRLVKIKKRSGDETVITFRDNYDINAIKFYQIDTVTINSDRKVKFEYNSYNLLTKITYKNDKIDYAYNYYKRLTTITYPDGNKTEFTYTNSGALESVSDVSGKKLAYSYKASQPFMVEKIEESSVYSGISNSSTIVGTMKGDNLTITYISKNLVKTIDNKNIVTIYNFDSEGNTTAVFENKDSDTSVMTPVSDINYGSRNQSYSISCKLPINAFSYAPQDTFTINADAQSDTKLTSLPSTLFKKGKTYVLSGFAKADSATIPEEEGYGPARTFELTAVVVYYGNTYETYHAKFDDRNTSWQMAATAFTVKEGLTGVNLYASYRNNINSAQFNNIKFIKCNAAITERKIGLCNDPNKYFEAEDIEKTTYKIKQNNEQDSSLWPERSHTLKVKYNDMVKMLEDVRTREILTVRASDGKYLVSNASAVKFKVKGYSEQFELCDLIIKNITKTETGTVESEYNPYPNNGTKFYASFDINKGFSSMFTMGDVTGISYVNTDGTREDLAKGTKGITESDVVNTIKALKNGRKVVYYNNCKDAAEPKNTYQVWIKTNKSEYQATIIKLMQFSETRKSINDGNKNYISSVRYDEYGQKILEKDIRGIETVYEYDKYGNLTYTETRHNKESLVIAREGIYSNGDHLASEPGEIRSGTNIYGYNEENGLLINSQTAKGNRIDYSYTDNKNLLGLESTVVNANGSTCNRNSFSYNKDYLTQVSHNGVNYDFTYSGLDDITQISIANNPVLTNAVSRSADGDTETTVELNSSGAMASNTVVSKDRYGRVKTVTRDGKSLVENTYDGLYSSARLKTTIDNCAGLTYNYDYDDDGEVFKIKYSGARSGTISTDKDEKKRIKNKTHTFGDGTALSYAYTYEDYPDETVSTITMADKFTQSVSYDSFQRLRSIKIISNGGFNYSETYSYLSPYKSGCTLQYVNIIDYTIGTKTETDNYEYDEDGNIKSITTGRGEITYEYDGLNRLVQEINNVTKKKYNFTYDAGGNILTQKVTNLYSMQVEKELWYYYDKSNKDRLVNINGVGISGYDMQGRPSYYRGWNLGWKNGRVNTFTKGNSTHTCEYDANGIRVKKIANGLQHEYYLEDDKIVREVVTGTNSYELLYLYGANGIAGFTYKKNGSTTNYYYRKNLQGDIVAVYGDNGEKCAEYVYDAWGNCTVFLNVNGIATLNPFRYRGYYWDSEFGLYYLNARYYDPEIGRFISQDDISYLDPASINGLNLFAYCLNNPVMETDPNGNSWNDLFAIFERFFTGISDICNYFVDHPEIIDNIKAYRKANRNISRREIHRQNEAAIKSTNKVGNIVGKIATVISLATLAVDIGSKWYSNYKSGSSTWVSDSAVDTLYIGIRYGISYVITAACSAIPIPVIGTAIGVALSIGVDYLIQFIFEDLGALDKIKGWAADVGTSITNWWNDLWSFCRT